MHGNILVYEYDNHKRTQLLCKIIETFQNLSNSNIVMFSHDPHGLDKHAASFSSSKLKIYDSTCEFKKYMNDSFLVETNDKKLVIIMNHYIGFTCPRQFNQLDELRRLISQTYEYKITFFWINPINFPLDLEGKMNFLLISDNSRNESFSKRFLKNSLKKDHDNNKNDVYFLCNLQNKQVDFFCHDIQEKKSLELQEDKDIYDDDIEIHIEI
jgi:hypothetical protein